MKEAKENVNAFVSVFIGGWLPLLGFVWLFGTHATAHNLNLDLKLSAILWALALTLFFFWVTDTLNPKLGLTLGFIFGTLILSVVLHVSLLWAALSVALVVGVSTIGIFVWNH